MAKDVRHVQFTPGDFLSDADFQGWTPELRGVYCSLIFFMYTNGGSLKNDQDYLRGLCNWTGEGWMWAYETVRAKFNVRGTKLYHKRVSAELKRARALMQARRQGGLTRAGQLQDTLRTPARTPGRTPSGKGREGKVSKEPPLPPELNTPEFSEVWAEWQQHRREIKKPLTPTSVTQQFRQLAAWGVPRAVAAIRHTIAKGWQGIREPDEQQAQQMTPQEQWGGKHAAELMRQGNHGTKPSQSSG